MARRRGDGIFPGRGKPSSQRINYAETSRHLWKSHGSNSVYMLLNDQRKEDDQVWKQSGFLYNRILRQRYIYKILYFWFTPVPSTIIQAPVTSGETCMNNHFFKQETFGDRLIISTKEWSGQKKERLDQMKIKIFWQGLP